MKSDSQPYKAFVSSTFEDLKEHRAHVIRQLRRAGFSVDPMEDWTADSDEPKRFSQDRLAGCDLCVLLVAFRRGFVPEGETRSITQMEYEAALQRGVDVLVFQLKDKVKWWAEHDERTKDPALEAWRTSLCDKHGVEFFTDEPHSIDPAGALGRWFAKKNRDQAEPEKLERIDWPNDRSPYPGLEWFDEDYAPLFFGRDREVDELVGKMSAPEGRFLIISGPSGSGKSSLVAAGLWQALVKEGRLPGSQQWRWLRITPAADSRGPFASLAAGLKQAFPKMTAQADDLARKLASDPAALARHIIPQMSQGQELVLFVDQLEELFTQACPSAEIQSFLVHLVTLSGDLQNRLRVVATVRSEFFGRLAESEDVREKINKGFLVLVGPILLMALQDMIQKPAAATGYAFEPELVGTILDDAGKEPGRLPLVAYALKQLFEQRQGSTFTCAAYKAMGGVVGAIGAKADQVMETLGQKAGASFDKVFAELVHIDRDRLPTRKRANLSGFTNDDEANKLIRVLAGPDCRVLVTAGKGQDATVTISHETLFEAWPSLKQYVATNIKELMDRTLLESRASKWAQLGRPWFSGLPSGREYKDFRRAATTPTALMREYLAASVRARWIQTTVIAVILVLVGGTGFWMWKEGLTVEDAMLTAQSTFMSIHIAPQMETIPGGTFKQDDTHGRGGKDEQRVHEVTVKPFAMGKYEVTFDEYKRFALAAKRTVPHDQEWGRGRRPVINVSWNDARDYAAWLSQETGKRYRLPTEAEWEYAARSGADNIWAGTSKEEELDQYAVFRADRTALVGGKKPNGPGLYDMSGNVWEWLEDCWHESYQGAPTDGSAWLEAGGGDCGVRVLRGGSWYRLQGDLRASLRIWSGAANRGDFIGFRLAQDLP